MQNGLHSSRRGRNNNGNDNRNEQQQRGRGRRDEEFSRDFMRDDRDDERLTGDRSYRREAGSWRSDDDRRMNLDSFDEHRGVGGPSYGEEDYEPRYQAERERYPQQGRFRENERQGGGPIGESMRRWDEGTLGSPRYSETSQRYGEQRYWDDRDTRGFGGGGGEQGMEDERYQPRHEGRFDQSRYESQQRYGGEQQRFGGPQQQRFGMGGEQQRFGMGGEQQRWLEQGRTGDGRGMQGQQQQQQQRRYPQGPKGYMRSDERIREDVCDRLSALYDVDTSDVEVSVNNGEVTLTGSVPHRSMKYRVEQTAEQVMGVKDIANHVRVKQQQGQGQQQQQTGVTGERTGEMRSSGESERDTKTSRKT